jgi:hypothetical protein
MTKTTVRWGVAEGVRVGPVSLAGQSSGEPVPALINTVTVYVGPSEWASNASIDIASGTRLGGGSPGPAGTALTIHVGPDQQTSYLSMNVSANQGTALTSNAVFAPDSSFTIYVGSPEQISNSSAINLQTGFHIGEPRADAATSSVLDRIVYGATHSLVMNPVGLTVEQAWSENMIAIGQDFQRAITGAVNGRRHGRGR